MKKGIILSIMMMFMLMLVGCIDADITLDMDKDGTGRMIIEMVAPDEMMNKLTQEEIAALEKEYEKVEIIEEEGKYGYKLTTKKENLSEINEDASGSLDSNFDYVKYVNLTEEKGLFANTYKVNLNLKDAMLGELSAEEKSMLAFVGGSANIGIHIKTPIELEESNATSVTEENGKYIYNWDYNLSNIGSINATMKAPNIINIGIVMVLVIAVVVGIVFVIRKKNKKENLDSDINKDDNAEE